MRVNAVFRRTDFKASEGASEADADAFFAQMGAGVEDAEIPYDHAGMAIVALNPRLATQMGAMSKFMSLELTFSKRADLRDLVVQTTHLKAGAGFAFEARIKGAKAAGLTADQLAVLGVWRTTSLFDQEQRLVIEYAEAVFDRAVSDELLSRFVAKFGEKGAIEAASLVGYWACWAMIIDVARP